MEIKKYAQNLLLTISNQIENTNEFNISPKEYEVIQYSANLLIDNLKKKISVESLFTLKLKVVRFDENMVEQDSRFRFIEYLLLNQLLSLKPNKTQLNLSKSIGILLQGDTDLDIEQIFVFDVIRQINKYNIFNSLNVSGLIIDRADSQRIVHLWL